MEEQLGDYIRRHRVANEEYRSLRQFAEVLGKSPSWVSKVERNQEIPGDETLLEIARLLGLPPEELFERAKRIDPAVKRHLLDRYTEVSGLLRTIRDLSPEQLVELEERARRLRDDAPG